MKTLALFALTLSLLSCQDPERIPGLRPQPSASVPTAGVVPNEDFRKTPPKSTGEITFVPPKIVEAKLGNGIRILIVERHELPIVAMNVLLDRGAELGTPGLASFTSAMLLQGTKTRSSLAISDALGDLGATYWSSGTFDSLGLSAKCLSSKLPDVLSILGDVMRNPAFEKAEVERERARRLTTIAQQKDSPATVLQNTLAEVLFPNAHPYHLPLLGTEASVKAITPEELAKFHAKTFLPNDVTITLAGDITVDKARTEVERVFGDWKGTAEPFAKPASPAAKKDAPKIVLVDRPGATQSHISFALVGVPRLPADDYAAIIVMNTILGGQFSSRLNLNLREKHAYTYGAGSGFDMRHGAGPFSAGGAIVREKTEPAMREIMSELDRIRTSLVSEEELADAKTYLIRKLPAGFETASETASSLAYLAIHGLPLDEYAKRPALYQKVTREDVKRVAEKYLRATEMQFVIVGDAKVIEKDLEKIGLGKMDVRRANKAK